MEYELVLKITIIYLLIITDISFVNMNLNEPFVKCFDTLTNGLFNGFRHKKNKNNGFK